MKVSMQWLGRYVDLTNIKAEDLADKLTLAGLEVEGVDPIAQGTNLVIGEVVFCEALTVIVVVLFSAPNNSTEGDTFIVAVGSFSSSPSLLPPQEVNIHPINANKAMNESLK